MQLQADAGGLRQAATSLRAAARQLRAAPVETRAQQIEDVARMLRKQSTPLGHALRGELAQSTGLSAELIEHGLETTLGLFESRALLALYESRPERTSAPAELVVSVLAGNVFSAAARPVLLPLLCGAAVLAKASSADDVLPRYLERALTQLHPTLGAACGVVTFSHGQAALEAALLHDADAVAAYGSDEALAALVTQVPAAARWLPHGHGLGAIAISADALRSEQHANALAVQAARDIVAYDQRGCLSPQLLFVQVGGACDPRAFARLLGVALAAVERSLPRAALSQAAAAAQMQWRGVAAALFELHAGDGWAVSYEGSGAPRSSPGYRNVSVYAASELAALCAQLSSFGPQLKALGVAGEAARHALAALAPYSCELGAMQTPPLHAALDGLHPLAGL